MTSISVRKLIGAVALVALVLPVAASSHPSIFNIEGKLAKSPEIQTITIDATGGTFKPSAGATPVAWNAPAYAVQAALGADPAIGRVTSGQANVLVTGSPGGPYTLRYQGSLPNPVPGEPAINMATTNRPQVVPDAGGLTGGAQTAIAATVKEGGLPDILYTGDPSGASLPDDVLRSVITNDGAVGAFVESNGVAAGGWLNLRFMPGGYRRPGPIGNPPVPQIGMTPEEWVTWPMAQTGIQSHATCQNVPELADVDLVLEVQNNPNEPFWNYVPWQKTSSGLGDEPDQWIEAVDEAVDVDLSGLNSVAQFRAACEALNPLGGGGVYVPADSPSNPAQGAINEAVAEAVKPLNALIADLQNQVQTLTERPLVVKLQAKRSKGKVIVMVTGPLGDPARITLRLSAADAKKLKVSRTIAASTKQLGSSGATLVTLTPSKAALKALAKRGKPINITVQAASGPLKAAASGSLAR